MSNPIITPHIEKTTVIAANGGYEQHPESYSPRVIAFVCDTQEYYELLRTGEAIPWGTTRPPESLEYWVVDVYTIHALGVHRAA